MRFIDMGPFRKPIPTMADTIADRYGRPRPTTPEQEHEIHAWAAIVGRQEDVVRLQRRYIGRLEARIKVLQRQLARKRFGHAAGSLVMTATATARFLCGRWPFSRKG